LVTAGVMILAVLWDIETIGVRSRRIFVAKTRQNAATMV
jgi:hypothetical protein